MKKISVIIPTFNEYDRLPRLLDDLDSDVVYEVIISDSGSTDGTQNLMLPNSKYRWVESKRGRANQMNTGATVATGDILLFLHADSQVTEDALKTIGDLLEVGVIAGSFPLKFDHKHWLLGVYERFSKINLSIFTYGDQGLFVKSCAFNGLNGFKNIPIMEDIDMIQRLRGVGGFVKSNVSITTSARRFRRNGILKQQLLNGLLVLLFKVGMRPSMLSKFYHYIRD